MAETKHYIEQVQECGTVLISEDVIVTIVANAITDTEGVLGLSAKPGADIADLLGKRNWGKGIRVTIDSQDELYIDCNLVLAYGQSVVAVAAAAQSAIRSAVESMTGVTVAAVNVNICGIAKK